MSKRHNKLYALAHARSLEGQVYFLRGEFQRGLDAAGEGAKLAAELGLPLWGAIENISVGWVSAMMGRGDDAVDLIRNGLAGLGEIGFRQVATLFLSMLSEAEAAVGRVDDALRTVEDGLQTNPEELIYRPHLLRLRGEFRIKNARIKAGDLELAEDDFRTAVALSQKWGAKSYELRATTSLARLLAKQGRRDEARTMLAEIYGWFTEGFDTRDLKEAKALLEELRTQPRRARSPLQSRTA